MKYYLAIIILFVTALSCRDNSFSDIPFKSSQWKTGDRLVRGSMVDHIIADSILIGKTKNDVFDLLGDPTASDTTGTSFVYEVDMDKKIGPLGMGGTWLFFLTVQFDSVSYKVDEVRCTD